MVFFLARMEMYFLLLNSFLQTIQSCLPNMLQNGKGHIVSLCNMFGLYDTSNNVPYCSSKYAVKGICFVYLHFIFLK